MSSGVNVPILRRSGARDLDDVRVLLTDVGLPIDDLDEEMLDEFLIAESDDIIVGLVGLQVYDTVGLLRSLVVANDTRRAGLGGRLVGAIEAAAQTAGIDELWLLTIDAQQYFERHGFNVVARDMAPDSIRKTEEFRELCPSDAYLMCKILD